MSDQFDDWGYVVVMIQNPDRWFTEEEQDQARRFAEINGGAMYHARKVVEYAGRRNG